jgi:hypothetical protein
MGASWAEHVALEMAAGEGHVLMCFYALIDTLDHEPAVEILRRAVKQEERHVAFGEQQTMKVIAGHPWRRRRLLGLSLVSLWAVRRLAYFLEQRQSSSPVLRQLPAFLREVIKAHELRMRRMGLIDRPLADLGRLSGAALVGAAYAGKLANFLGTLLALPLRLLPGFPRQKRLTDTYLSDPALRPSPDTAEVSHAQR